MFESEGLPHGSNVGTLIFRDKDHGFPMVSCPLSQQSLHRVSAQGQRERQLERWNRRRMAQEEAVKVFPKKNGEDPIFSGYQPSISHQSAINHLPYGYLT